MTTGRYGQSATLLQNGQVLVAGGNTAELYNPATRRWTATANMPSYHQDAVAPLLPNGEVLVVGGNAVSFPELYDPSSGQFTAVAEPCRCVSFQPVKGDAAKQNPRLLTMLDFPREAGATLSGIAFPKSSSSPL